jgi:hypothetical protein
MNGNTPSYIKSLLMPRAKAPQGRRVWNIDLETVLVPFFTATNTTGDTSIPHDALGAPLRLGYAKDGAVKFRPNGRPVIVVAKPIRDAVSMLRENFVANLADHAHKVATEHKDDYQAQVQFCVEAGKPVIDADNANLDKAVKARLEKELADAAKGLVDSVHAPADTREAVPA